MRKQGFKNSIQHSVDTYAQVSKYTFPEASGIFALCGCLYTSNKDRYIKYHLSITINIYTSLQGLVDQYRFLLQHYVPSEPSPLFMEVFLGEFGPVPLPLPLNNISLTSSACCAALALLLWATSFRHNRFLQQLAKLLTTIGTGKVKMKTPTIAQKPPIALPVMEEGV